MSTLMLTAIASPDGTADISRFPFADEYQADDWNQSTWWATMLANIVGGYTYIYRFEDGYVGKTNDMLRRMAEHAGKHGKLVSVKTVPTWLADWAEKGVISRGHGPNISHGMDYTTLIKHGLWGAGGITIVLWTVKGGFDGRKDGKISAGAVVGTIAGVASFVATCAVGFMGAGYVTMFVTMAGVPYVVYHISRKVVYPHLPSDLAIRVKLKEIAVRRYNQLSAVWAGWLTNKETV